MKSLSAGSCGKERAGGRAAGAIRSEKQVGD
ncbi:hypothetical protein NK6_4664 [Bradyrhizobium diazoefficiens]|uniref:Uncharacterized protein n=1 Tax=Bradyrhizobium diazoefficiens TaxID=1355477 RepID=A0A0E4FUG6_9BRAD|nr:hypothetical protein NK6_4664 [Bradyrhizobium diazoefficiens]